jgi:hypothetical protein
LKYSDSTKSKFSPGAVISPLKNKVIQSISQALLIPTKKAVPISGNSLKYLVSGTRQPR